MREKTSFYSKMVDRNWLTKRKRKRVPGGSDLSNGKESVSVSSESPIDNPPVKRRLKSDSNLVASPNKKKGNDGYYYECVICDLGGNLLCCDSCPRTYHLQCLNPPLKRTPPGKWHCPKCCEQKDSSIRDPESISKRESLKFTIQRSKTDIKSSGSDKGLRIVENSIAGNNKSLNKVKPTISCKVPCIEKKSNSSQTGMSGQMKSSHSSHAESAEGTSACAIAEIEKKPSCTNTSGQGKPGSPKKNIHPSGEVLDLETNGESSDQKPGLPCNTGSPEKELGHPLISTSQKVKKRKRKLIKEDNIKKSRDGKGKCSKKSACISGAKPTSVSAEVTNTCSNHNSVDNKDSVSPTNEGLGAKFSGIQHKDVKCPEENLQTLNELDDLGDAVDTAIVCEENLVVENQQVDRILGCRLQVQPLAYPAYTADAVAKNSSSMDTTDLPSVSTENQVNILDQHSACDKGVDAEFTHGSHLAVNQTDRKRNIENIKVDKLHVYRRLSVKKCVESNAIDSPGRDLKGKGPSNDESGRNIYDTRIVTDKVVPADSSEVQNVTLSNHGTHSVPETCGTPHPSDTNTEDLGMETSMNSTHNKIVSIMESSIPLDEDTTTCEFLVKWMGQSHIHNSWVSEAKLKVLAKRKLENYKAKYGTAVMNICQDEWSQPQKVIALRDFKNGINEAYVKWCGLPYDECTWENLDEPAIRKSSHLIVEFKQFERQTLDNDVGKSDTLKNKSDRQQSEIFPLIEQPKELKGGSLFEHQLEALNWLRKCWHKSKNVILADEMGLGKTVSACAFISSLYLEFKVKLPCLVLVPLSTMPNWLSEFSLWAPHLNVVEYHGCAKARSLIRQYEWHATHPDGVNNRTKSYKFNVLLTTYEMVLVDSSYLRGVPWEVLIVDEGHRLKNSGSKLFGLLNTISFQHRVLLTGTPLQNNIGEMFNLLNFLQPASFPSLSSFEEKFNDLTSAERVEELKKLVAPHMLRRLKKDVMKNIPPKTERIVPVELSSIQAEYYRAMLTKNYNVLRNIGKGVPQQSMLNIVMQLRKVCNHPYLIPGTEPDSGSVEFLQEMRIKASAKLTLLHAMLKILNKEGHRVLIFSQMTKLLDILEDYLTIEFGPKTYERVDGSVSVADRQAAIARFNQDKSRFVFLLSTRSCGLGINLATADTVIIYDSDFNPHADIQAMNRAHRIGQSNRLLVYRLVVRASVEERILQLAKKKLMLDQLFMNKSESQKEVEDILRWGTEELFSDSLVTDKDKAENFAAKDGATAESESKHRRRAGGLGDVYQDKCTDGNTKVLWDENAILRLLDRTILQSGSSEGAEGELDNDMLGSVKALDWNDEPTEEQGVEMPAVVAVGVCPESSDKKEDAVDRVVGGTEENEWDRLLRVRWEKYQSEEEAVLGRGKRLRKAVVYNEAFAPHPVEPISENGHEEEPVPEREYTPAGRALKAKFSKLRARQKERLAQRNVITRPLSTGDQLGPKQPPQRPSTNNNEGECITKPDDNLKQQTEEVDLIDNDISPLSMPKYKNDSTSRVAKVSKQGYRGNLSSHLDLSVRPPDIHTDVCIPSNPSATMSSTNSFPDCNLLPVLGLCAPNANQHESAQKNRHESCNPSRSNFAHCRTGKSFPEFPFHLASGFGTSGDMNIKGKEVAGDTCALLDTPLDVSQHRFKSSILDGSFPFGSYPRSNTHGIGFDPLESSGASVPAFRRQMVLPDVPFEDNYTSKLSHSTKNVSRSYPDLYPNLSLGTNVESTNQDLPAMPLLPTFRLLPQDMPKHSRQVREVPPVLGLGQMQSTYSSLPENHKKVLDNIMMRTGSGANNLFKKRSKIHAWSEDELDALWVGVRRHGKGNWDAMLKNPRLKFSKYRTCEDLSVRWEEEQAKIFDEAVRLVPRSAKAATFSGISDEMMTRALQGSKLAGFAAECSTPLKFRSHLTDMHLGYGDLTSGLLPVDASDQFASVNERYMPFRSLISDEPHPNLCGDFTARASDRPATSLNSHLEQQFHLNSLASNNVSMGMNSSNIRDLRQKDELGANKYFKLPTLLDRSPAFLHDLSNNRHSGESTSTRLLSDPNKELNCARSVNYDATGSTSAMNKLPHWLRDAVNVPARPPEPELPPTVSAIAHSVRLLYGEQRPTIPPFTVPGPPPSQPKDPRRSLKKKSKSRKLRRMTPNIALPSINVEDNSLADNATSGTIPPAPPMARMPGFPWIESNPEMPSLNLNLMGSQPSSSYINHRKKQGMGMTPSPEVLKLVASCVAPGPLVSSCPGMGSSSFLGTDLPLPRPSEVAAERENTEVKDIRGKQVVGQSQLVGWAQPQEEITEQTESGDSSKTHSDVRQVGHPEGGEVSSEGTVSDDHGSQEP